MHQKMLLIENHFVMLETETDPGTNFRWGLVRVLKMLHYIIYVKCYLSQIAI